MKKIFYSLLFIHFSFVFSQNQISLEIIDSITINSETYLGKDNFENYYHIEKNQLFKTGKTKEFQYKNVSLGKLTKVSFENNLQPILLYEDFNTVILLDNQLNEVQKIEFNLINPFLKITAIGFGGQNKMWFFDSNTQKFGLYDFINSSVKFLSNSQNTEITQLNSNYNYFYYTDKDFNYYRISIYGKKTSLGKLPTLDTICFFDSNNIIYKYNNL